MLSPIYGSKLGNMHTLLYLLASVLYVLALMVFLWARFNFFKSDLHSSKSYLLKITIGIALLTCILIVAEKNHNTIRSLFSILLSTCSLSLFVVSIREFHNDMPMLALSSNQTEKLVFTGPYSFVRHPIYLSYIINWIAPVVLTLNIFAAVAVMGIITMYINIAIAEERVIEQSPLSHSYRLYQREVPMLIPRRLYPGGKSGT